MNRLNIIRFSQNFASLFHLMLRMLPISFVMADSRSMESSFAPTPAMADGTEGSHIDDVPSNIPVASEPPLRVHELLDMRKTCSSDDHCAQLLQEQVIYSSSNYDSLRRKIAHVVSKSKKLKNKNSKKIDTFLLSNFEPIVSRAEQILAKIQNEEQKEIAQKLITEKQHVDKENKSLKRQCSELLDEKAETEQNMSILTEKLNTAIHDMTATGNDYNSVVNEQQNGDLKIHIDKYDRLCKKQSKEINQLSDQLATAQTKLSKMNMRNVNKKIKRKTEKVANLESALKETNEANIELQIQCDESRAALEKEKQESCDIKSEKHTLQKSKSKLRLKMKSLKDAYASLKEQNEMETYHLSDQLQTKEKEISELETIINLADSDVVQTFQDGRYTDEVRECCMTLLAECNVSLNKLPNIIKTVLATFTGKIPERLPSKTLLNWLMAEAKVIASKQVATGMIEGLGMTNTGNVLHQDATTKYHVHYEGAQVTLKDGSTMSIGLKQVSGGDGKTYIHAFEEMIDDLAASLGTEGFEENKAKLICSIKNFMSDQCATNGIFNEGIEKIRKTLLPATFENFDKLSEVEKEQIGSMGHFACRLHLLANFGIESDKAMSSFESSVAEGRNPHSFKSDESGSMRLARTAAKAFTKRGSDKAGVHSYWETYLRDKGKKNTLITYHGHRINIAFHDGAAVYHHRADIANFLHDWPEPNGLLKSIMFDVNEPAYLAGCRAVGIFDKLVTGPFWRILETDGSILDLNDDLHQMQLRLNEWAQNGDIPFSGEPMFAGVEITKDAVYDSLFMNTDNPSLDAMTVMALELLSSQLLLMLERQAKTQLPDGHYYDPSDELKQMASNVPKTNAISERDMAVLDNLLRIKPAASTLTIEAIVMCTKNKPFTWLRSLEETERQNVMEDARKMGSDVKRKFKERKAELEKKMSEKLKEKKQKVEKKEQKELNQNISISRDIVQYGGPWSVDEVDPKIEAMQTCDIRKAVLCQIKFHKNVLRSKGNKELFQESHNKKKYSDDELISNLKHIIEINDTDTNDEASNVGLTYKETEMSRQEINDKKAIVMRDLVKARKKRKVDQQKKYLDMYIESPEMLVSKKVQHKCMDGEEQIWFTATVNSIRALKENRIKTEYNITYDDQPQDQWFFPLLRDMKNGDLLVLD